MTSHAADMSGKSPVRAVRRELTYLRCNFTVGATGAVGTLTEDDAGWGVTRADVGDYDIVFPKAPKGEPPTFHLVDAPAVSGYQITAFDPAAGTASVLFIDDAAAAVEVDADAVMYISIWLDEGP